MNPQKNKRLAFFFIASLVLCSFFQSCSKENHDDVNCNQNQTARMTVKNMLPHGIWVDVRTQLNENNNKRFLMPGESFVFVINAGSISLTTSFSSNDNDFKIFRSMDLKACHDIEVEINKICTIFNTIESVKIENKTSKTIIVDVVHHYQSWAGENIIQPNESYTYYQINPGYVGVYYRYTDTLIWKRSPVFFITICNKLEFSCGPY
jgi:hypothetical protein